MKKQLIFLFLIFAAACASSSEVRSDFSVQHFGVLREIMMDQKIEANVQLEDMVISENLFGLGALEGLSGELIILEGKAYKATFNDSSEVVMHQGMTGGATLLVTSEIRAWKTTTVNQQMESLSALQEYIQEAAKEMGLNTDEPFPFLLDGVFPHLSYHIINAPGAIEQTHEGFKNSGVTVDYFGQNARILGFYSSKHEGIFTHHGSYLHLHILTKDLSHVGHIDELFVPEHTSLKLPKQK